MPEVSPLRKWGSLVILSLALAIIIIDTTLLNVSLGTIIRELHTDIQSIQWVITAYALVLAALTITGGRLGDLFGRKRMFMTGAVLFAIGSFLASISNNVPTLIWGESIIEGLGAALMMPATSSLLVANFRGRDRAIAFGVWGGIAAASSAIGPILGGYLTSHYSWRWGFRINVFVVVILLLGSFLINDSRDTKEKPTLDWLGVFLSSTGLLAIVFGVIEASKYGWWHAKDLFMAFGHTLDFGSLSIVPYALLLGIILLGLFGFWERNIEASGQTPLVSMNLFKNQQFTSGAITSLVFALAMSGLIFTIPVFLQGVLGLDAYQTGLSLLPMSLTILIVAPLGAAVLSSRIKPKYLIQLGLVLSTLAFVVLRQSISLDAQASDLRWGLILFGGGIGLIMAQLNNLTLSAVPVHQAGEASGVANTFRQLGSTFGSAIIGSVLLTVLAAQLTAGVQNSPVIPDTIKPVLAESIAKQTSNVEFGGGAHLGAPVSTPVAAEITSIGHQATVDAIRTSLAYGALFSLLGVLVALNLPGVSALGRPGATEGDGRAPGAGH